MSLLDLVLVYLALGAASAIAGWRRRRDSALGSLLLGAVVWPLWAPFVLFDEPRAQPEPRPEDADLDPDLRDRFQRLEAALADAADAAAASPYGDLLAPDAMARLRGEVRRACERARDLRALTSAPGSDPESAKARLRELEASSATPAAIHSARVHASNVERMARLDAAHADALVELEQVLATLRSQLVLSRFAGSSGDGVDAIVGELWARIDGLHEALAEEEVAPTGSTEGALRVA